jgi:hypothetical protein
MRHSKLWSRLTSSGHRLRRGGAALICAAIVGSAGAASAGPRADGNPHYQSANAAFDRSDFTTALREYEAAFHDTNDPDILFNLGQAARFCNQFEKAKKAYSDYITALPNTPDKQAIREEIQQLDDLAKHAERVRVTPPIGRNGPPTIETVGDPQGVTNAMPAFDTSPLGSKRVLLLVTEMNGPQIVRAWTDGVWTLGGGNLHTTVIRQANELDVLESTLSDKLTEAGFNVVDAGVLKGRMAPPARFEAVLGNDDAREVALHSCADLVMVVKGEGHAAQPSVLGGSGMFSGQSNVTARLIRVNDGVVVAAATEHAAQVHIDAETARANALTEAGKMVAAKITSKTNNM